MAKSSYAGLFRLEPFDPGDDPDAAPGAFRGEGAERPWSWRRARQNGLWIYAVGLVFLIFSVGALINSRPSAGESVVRTLQLLAIALGYAGGAWVSDASLKVRWLYVMGFAALLLTTFPFVSWGVLYYVIYVTILVSTLIPWRQARMVILAVGLATMVAAVMVNDSAALSIGFTGLFVGWASGGGMEAGRLSRKLDHSRKQVSVLAVAAERERIGRDLHDILGHSLTAISIKSGLAAKLIDHDPAAAKAEISDIEEIARQALGDVRSTASGYREVRVPVEVASARSVLQAAGMQARVPSAIEALPDEVSELFGYVMREAVTNVVRHSEATTCTIEVDSSSITVRDDGKGFARSATICGSGLQGLTQRLEAVGGRLTVVSRPGGGTEVRAELAPTARADDDTTSMPPRRRVSIP